MNEQIKQLTDENQKLVSAGDDMVEIFKAKTESLKSKQKAREDKLKAALGELAE